MPHQNLQRMKQIMLKNPINKKLIVTAFLTIFIFLYLWQNYTYIKMDSGPEDTDWHIIRSAIWYKTLVLGEKNLSSQFRPPREIHHPPVVYFVTMPFFMIKGMTLEAARLSLSVFVIIFLLSMFGIGREYGGFYGGAAIMALAASSPHTLNLSRTYYQDFPQTAMTALSFYLMLKTDFFRNRLYTIILGIILALSIMTKWSSAFFLIIPAVWFLAPALLKAKGILTRILTFAIPASLTLGVFAFFESINGKSDYNWLFRFFIYMFIPIVLWCVILFFLDKKSAKDDSYKESWDRALVNFSVMNILLFLFAAPWFFWAGNTLKDKWIYEMTLRRNIPFNLSIHLTFLKTAFNYAPILVIIGIILMFVKKDDLYRKLLLPVNVLLIFIFMVERGSPQFRYIYSIIIFMAVMGGYWVAYAKKMKPYLAGGLVFMSMLSILAWTVIPGNLSFYLPVKIFDYQVSRIIPVRILCSEAPEPDNCNLEPLVDSVLSVPSSPAGYYIVVNLEKDWPFEFQHLSWLAFKRGKFLKSPDIWFLAPRDNGMLEVVETGPDRLNRNALIVHRKETSPIPAVNTLMETSVKDYYIAKTFDVGRGFYITHVELKYYGDPGVKFDVKEKKVKLKPEPEISQAFNGIDAGNFGNIRAFLKEHPDFIDTQYRGGRSLLQEAAGKGYEELAEYLISSGANVERRDFQTGRTALHYAALGGSEKITKLLLLKGAEVNTCDMEWRVSPLHLAAMNGYDGIARLLLEKGANVNERDRLDMTPLHLAAKYGRTKVAAVLLEFGANVKMKDRFFGKTPEQWANHNGFNDLVKIIREHSRGK